LSIRDWQPEDAAACAAIYAPYVRDTTVSFELDPPDAAELARRFIQHRDNGYPVLVAQRDARVIGYAYASSFRARPAYRHTVEHSVYVDARGQRGGVGRQLMQALIEACAKRGFRVMVAVISDPTAHASVAFHHSLGFEPAGLLRGIGRKFGRDLDVAMLQRRIEGKDVADP
jgi:phosphinothricin acetyltransferase